MKSFQLPSSEEKADYVLRQFDRIAGGYDLANDAISLGMHRFWKAQAITSLAITAGGHYLDVCCGTGDLTLAVAQRLGRDGKAVGLDFSNGMLDVARSRQRRLSFEAAVEWICGDAQNLPFADGTFDGAIISFGLRNLTDLQRGLDEMARVVKPGGKVINLDLGHSRLPLFAPLFQFYFSHVVPIIGSILQGDKQAYTYLPASLGTYPKPEAITQMFQQAGLRSVIHVPLALGSVALHVGTVPQESNR